jgi:hypothetical protein
MTAGDNPDISPFDDPDADGPTERVVPIDPEKTVVITPTSPADRPVAADPGPDERTVEVTPPPHDDDEATVVVRPPTPAATPVPPAAPPPPQAAAAPTIAGSYAPAHSYGAPPAQPVTPLPGGYAPAATYGTPPPPVPSPAVAARAPAARHGRAHWVIPVAVAAGVVLLAVVTVLVVQPRPVKSLFADRLNIAGAQPAIRAVLTDPAAGYGLPRVTDVTCNHGSDPDIISGATFGCDVTVAGHPLQVTMTFLNDDGAYSVGRPQ